MLIIYSYHYYNLFYIIIIMLSLSTNNIILFYKINYFKSSIYFFCHQKIYII